MLAVRLNDHNCLCTFKHSESRVKVRTLLFGKSEQILHKVLKWEAKDLIFNRFSLL